MEGLKVADANLVVYVHPAKAKSISQAILCELSALLFEYNETFEGVLLAYDVNILDKVVKILPSLHPLFGVRLSAKLLLFSPQPNMLVDGKVVKISQESVHVVVLGFSSAVITDVDIREEFKYKIRKGEARFISRADKHHMIKVGTMLRFQVKSFDEEMLHISGSLVPVNTGCIRWLHKSSEDTSQTDRESKKRRKADDQETKMLEKETESHRDQVRTPKKHKSLENH